MTSLALKAPGLHLHGLEAETAAEAQTAVTAWVGVAERGPLNSPQAIRNWGEYRQVFGGPAGFGIMAQSVYAFFQNGGAQAYIVRVARDLPPSAPAPCQASEGVAIAQSAAVIRDGEGLETLRLFARHPGSYGNALSAAFTADSPRDMELAQLAVAAAAGDALATVGFVQDFTVGGSIRIAHRDNAFLGSVHQVLARDAANGRLTLAPVLPRAYPAGSKVLGRGFRLQIDEGNSREVYEDLSMNPMHARHVAGVVNGPAGLQELDAARQGHSALARVEQVFGGAGASRGKPATSAVPVAFRGGGDGFTMATATLRDAVLNPSLQVTSKIRGRDGNSVIARARPFAGRIALAVAAGRSEIVVERIGGWVAGDTVIITDAAVPAVTEAAVILGVSALTHVLTLSAPLANAYALFSALSVANRFDLAFERSGHPESGEIFRNLSIAAGPRFAPDIVNGIADPASFSALVCLQPALGAGGIPAGEAALAGGADPGEMPIRRYTGYQEDGSLYLPGGSDPGPMGLAVLEGIDGVNLVCAPDVAALPGLSAQDLRLCHSQMLFHCRKLGDRFALLDPPRALGLESAWEWPGGLQDGTLPRFGAAYYPWLTSVVEGDSVFMPPSGAVAGILAGVDKRHGVGKAPGNEVFKGVLSLEREVAAEDQGELNVRGVNVIRKFESGAIRLYGARTLSPEDGHVYVHNRRLVVAVVKALSRNLRWAVFEPNDPALRRRVKDSLEGYFQALLAKGLTAGSKPGEAYYVKVDAEVNTSDTMAAGQLVAEVGIALSRPAEFIVITVKRRPEILALVEEEA